MPPFGSGSCYQPEPKASFQQPKGRETEIFGSGWWHQPEPKGGHWSRLVLRTGTNATLWFRLMVPTGTKGLAPRCGRMFSPTSLVEGDRERFISAVAPSLSSSSQLQHFGPTPVLFACVPDGPGSW